MPLDVAGSSGFPSAVAVVSWHPAGVLNSASCQINAQAGTTLFGSSAAYATATDLVARTDSVKVKIKLFVVMAKPF
jgi:hypothetical protein